jgi:hypothetical protein
MESVPESKVALDLIREIYVVEHEAKETGIVGTPQHLELRATRSSLLMTKLKDWLEAQHRLHPPKSAMAVAVGYALKNWEALTRFLGDARIPPDNNRSEAALRAIALGRKNYLFVGNEDAGENIAGLYSLVATCEANRVNPLAYLRDVSASAPIPQPVSTNCCPIAGLHAPNRSFVNHVAGRTVTTDQRHRDANGRELCVGGGVSRATSRASSSSSIFRPTCHSRLLHRDRACRPLPQKSSRRR